MPSCPTLTLTTIKSPTQAAAHVYSVDGLFYSGKGKKNNKGKQNERLYPHRKRRAIAEYAKLQAPVRMDLSALQAKDVSPRCTLSTPR